MMEGLKEAMEYLVDLSAPDFKEHEGELYADKKMYRVHTEEPLAEPLHMSTLTSLIDYIGSGTDALREKMLIHVESPTVVSLQSMLDGDRRREKIAVVQANIPSFTYERFYDSEEFTIRLQALFVDGADTDKELILKYTGTMEAGTVKKYGDDGVSQSAVIQQSLTSKEEVIVPNPVTLRPYRTFTEVEQPKSDFIFRAKDGRDMVGFALFEADGGAWKNEAMKSIHKYISGMIEEVSLSGVEFIVIS